MSGKRLTTGGVIRRSAPISFHWNGKALEGCQGDTLSSALLANGVEIVGRSFKYHRPRGVTSAGVEEAGALVRIGVGAEATPNVNASMLKLTPGLRAFGQNAWPSVNWDMLAATGVVDSLLGPVFAAGFYYKTFFSFLPFGRRTGTGEWMVFEKFIRRAAGMGTLSASADPAHYETAHGFCDTLVVGSGPAGLAAARQLAEAGRDVVLAEQDFAVGGRLLSDLTMVETASPLQWRDEQLQAFQAAGGRVMRNTSVFGLYDGGVCGMVETVNAPDLRERLWVLRARRVLLATGAIERGLAFGDNDRPGVMTASALRSYVNRFGVMPGKKAALVATDDSAYTDLAALQGAIGEVDILDLRDAANAPAIEGARQMIGAAPYRVRGRRRVTGLDIVRHRDGAWCSEDPILACDLVAVSGGWQPTLHLLAQRGVKLIWSAEQGAFIAGDQPGGNQPSNEPAVEICGAAQGYETPDQCAQSGRAAAARILGEEKDVNDPELSRHVIFEIRQKERKTPGKSFVDLQHDVTAEDVRLAEREGFVSVEHLKRYTTLGMANDQGKTSNVLGLGIMADARGVTPADVGTTGFRPPFTPVSLGVLAAEHKGAHFVPERRTPMHEWNHARGAVMTDAGLWKRPWYFPLSGEGLDEAYVREATRARKAVALCDVSSLGKILLQGPDAAAFLNRIYVNGFAKLPVGKARYGVMLRDDGVVFDDGTVWRLGEQDFLITTTTTGAGKVMSWIEKLHQTRWPELRITMVSVSDSWAGLAVTGPLSRRVLARTIQDVDFDDAALGPMAVRQGRVGDQNVWVARLSFSGELAYEVMIDADYGTALAEALWDVAEPMGGMLYGLEALSTLRVEKGHVAGSELDGRTTLDDLELGGMASKAKHFIGKALSQRPGLTDVDREKLVGLIPADGERVFKAGGIICRRGWIKGHGIGWVSAVTHSPALGCWIGLGFIEGGHKAWANQQAIIADPVRNTEVRVRVVSPHMYDPSGKKMRPDEDPVLPSGYEPRRAPPKKLARRSALDTFWPTTGDGNPLRYGRSITQDVERLDAHKDDGPVWMSECPPTPIWRLSAWPGERTSLETMLSTAFKTDMPGFGESATLAGGAALLRINPLNWLLIGTALTERPDPDIAQAADLGSGLARIRIGGEKAAPLINRFLPIDLREGCFDVGSVAGAGLHGAPVVLHRVAENTFDLFVMRSYLRSFWDLIETNARRF